MPLKIRRSRIGCTAPGRADSNHIIRSAVPARRRQHDWLHAHLSPRLTRQSILLLPIRMVLPLLQIQEFNPKRRIFARSPEFYITRKRRRELTVIPLTRYILTSQKQAIILLKSSRFQMPPPIQLTVWILQSMGSLSFLLKMRQ